MSAQAARCAWIGFPDRRWALEAQNDGTAKIFVFSGESQREQWLKRDPTRAHRRQAVGKRHPCVKTHRRRVSGRTNI